MKKLSTGQHPTTGLSTPKMNTLILDAMNQDLPDDLQKLFSNPTYSHEDNKLRMTANYWFDRETWLYLKSFGLKHAPKQELVFFPSHTIAREDFIVWLTGEELELEEVTLEDRANAKLVR